MKNLKMGCAFICHSLLIVLFLTVHSNAHATTRKEYAVKAAFVLNFILFTEWPEETMDGSKKELILCVVGENDLPDSFKALNGRNVRGQLVKVVHAFADTNIPECQVIFYMGDVDTQNLVRTLKAVHKKSVLTIGERKKVTNLGGAIHFFMNGGKLRFAINPEIVSEHGLKMSSRLLQIATIIND